MQIEQRILTSGSWWSGYYDRAAICDHIMQGNIEGSEARFNNKSEEVSAHFGVGKTGRVVQWVSMINSAWANGILENGFDVTLPWLMECKVKGIEVNRRTISIEHEGNSGDVMPEAQYQATLQLHAYIIQLWPNIKPGRKTIVGHNQISPSSKPFCPGSGFPFERLIADLQKEFPTMPFQKVPGNIPVSNVFTDFWFTHGGLAVFGFPLEPERDARAKYDKAIKVQYFERARFELQPDGKVFLGLVGSEAWDYRNGGKTL